MSHTPNSHTKNSAKTFQGLRPKRPESWVANWVHVLPLTYFYLVRGCPEGARSPEAQVEIRFQIVDTHYIYIYMLYIFNDDNTIDHTTTTTTTNNNNDDNIDNDNHNDNNNNIYSDNDNTNNTHYQ